VDIGNGNRLAGWLDIVDWATEDRERRLAIVRAGLDDMQGNPIVLAEQRLNLSMVVREGRIEVSVDILHSLWPRDPAMVRPG
jgi:hypothetical protein